MTRRIASILTQKLSSGGGRGGRLGTNTVSSELGTPVSLLLVFLCFTLRGKLLELLLHALDVALLGDQALEPLVLHLELVDPVLKGGNLVGHFLGLLLESGLTLLLLDTEASRGGCVATTLVLLSGEARLFLEVGDWCEVGSRGLALVTGLDEAVGLGWVRTLEAVGRTGRKAGRRLGERVREGLELGELVAGAGHAVLLLRGLGCMLLEVDRCGDAEVEVEELGGGEVVEVAVVKGEVGSGLLLVVGGDGVEVGEVLRHVGCPAASEV